jgi:ElaB/YqjD/DUF883 family membrane-anchored ribosome-binding protein
MPPDDVAEEFDEGAVDIVPPHPFETFVRENPMAAVAGALVAGFILGRLQQRN